MAIVHNHRNTVNQLTKESLQIRFSLKSSKQRKIRYLFTTKSTSFFIMTTFQQCCFGEGVASELVCVSECMARSKNRIVRTRKFNSAVVCRQFPLFLMSRQTWCFDPSSVEQTSKTNARHSNVSCVSLLVTTCSEEGVNAASLIVIEGLILHQNGSNVEDSVVHLSQQGVMRGLHF